MSQTTITSTDFQFSDHQTKYQGKVRDVYSIDDKVVLIASDRISAFDVVSKQGIPYKGQVLNQIAAFQLNATKDIVPNWVQSVPDPNVTIGRKAAVIPVEVIVRGYLVGSAWRTYKSGKRVLCGNELPDGMQENQQFSTPIITPTTKASEGHDEDISESDILAQEIVSESDWQTIKEYAFALFEKGQQIADEQGLILVDTKYEFGKTADGEIILVDEIHTPDSSRYFYADEYQQRFEAGEKQKQLSKEFVREWLMDQGYKGESPEWPEMPEEFVQQVSDRYIELYQKITGKKFERADYANVETRIFNNVKAAL